MVHKLTSRGSYAARVDVLLKLCVIIVTATQQFALVHVKCMTRLRSLCHAVLASCQKVESEEDVQELQRRVRLLFSIVKLSLDLSKACTNFQFEKAVLKDIVELAAATPVLFERTYDCGSIEHDYLVDTNVGCSLSTLIDELIQLLSFVLPDYKLFSESDNIPRYFLVGLAKRGERKIRGALGKAAFPFGLHAVSDQLPT